MQKQGNYSASADHAVGDFSTNLEFSSQNPVFHPTQSSSYDQQQQKWQQQHQQHQQLMFETSNGINGEMAAVDRTLSFADVMQLADFGPKLALHHPQQHDDYQQQHSHQQNEDQGTNYTDDINRDHADNNNNNDTNNTGVDPVYFLKFPVLSHNHNSNHDGGFGVLEEIRERDDDFDFEQHDGDAGPSEATENNNNCDYNHTLELEFLGNASVTNTDDNIVDLSGDKIMGGISAGGVIGKSSSNSKRKRPRTIKTSEEVESQRMTHIAVERNRRKQMNEHLRVLRSLMPSSYVQRGDQASIIGGAIEFVRELEQLLQCLESQKRRRLYGDQPTGPPAPRPMGDSTTSPSAHGLVPQPPLGFPPPLPLVPSHHEDDQLRIVDQLDPSSGGGALMLQEESAESKSCIADVEVKVLGFDALIKILSRRRPGQLIKAIAALEDLHFTILHTNITTIEQTVLYSFNVKVASEARFTAEDIASSVQQIFTFIHANTDII